MGIHADTADAVTLTAFYAHLVMRGHLKVNEPEICACEVKAFIQARAEKREAEFGKVREG